MFLSLTLDRKSFSALRDYLYELIVSILLFLGDFDSAFQRLLRDLESKGPDNLMYE